MYLPRSVILLLFTFAGIGVSVVVLALLPAEVEVLDEPQIIEREVDDEPVREA